MCNFMYNLYKCNFGYVFVIYNTQKNYTYLQMGLSYGWDARTNFGVHLKSDASGLGGSTVSLSFSRKSSVLPTSISQQYRQ